MNLSEEDTNINLKNSEQLSNFLLTRIKRRKTKPGDDLISRSCHLNNSESIITDSEIITLCLNTLLATTEPEDKSLAMFFKNPLEK